MTDPKRDVNISMNVQVSKQFLADILTGMAETCPEMTGWFGDENTNIVRIKEGEDWLQPLSVLRISGRYDDKDSAEGERKGRTTIDMASVALGLSRAVVYENLNSSIRERILGGIVGDDAGEIDSEACDVIAQLAIFGEIIYG